MTFREKLRMEHPDLVNDRWTGGCYRCPHDYGYLEKDIELCVNSNIHVETTCKKCWDREIPGTEKTAELKPIDPHNVFNKMAEKHRACYDSYKCFGFTDEQAFELVRIMFEKDVVTGETALL